MSTISFSNISLLVSLYFVFNFFYYFRRIFHDFNLNYIKFPKIVGSGRPASRRPGNHTGHTTPSRRPAGRRRRIPGLRHRPHDRVRRHRHRYRARLSGQVAPVVGAGFGGSGRRSGDVREYPRRRHSAGIPQMASPGCRRWQHKGRTSTNPALNRTVDRAPPLSG